MKLRKILMGLAAVVGFTTAATAATPVAVFEGESLNGGTVGGYTLSLNGNTYADGAVTITSTSKGISLTSSTTWGGGSDGITAIIKYSSLTAGSGSREIASFKLGSKNDCVGTRIDGTGASAGTYAGNDWDKEGTGYIKGIAVPASDVVFVGFKDAEYTKMFGTDNSIRGAKTLYYGASLREGGKTVGDLITIGSMDNGKNIATDMVITGIAIYKGFMSSAERAAFLFPSEIAEYYATMEGDTGFGTLNWSPDKPEEGFTATDTLIITNLATSVANLNFDENLSALKLKIVSEPAKDAGVSITKDDEVTVAIGTYDFSEAESQTIIEYETSASVIAGADTSLLAANNPSLTIAEGKKLTVNGWDNGASLTASKVSNAGTLNFVGGTEDEPIALTGNANFGIVTLAEDTYVKNTVDNNRNHIVTGSGFSSFYAVSKASGEPGMGSDNALKNLTFVTDTASEKRMWVERITIDDEANVALEPITTMYLATTGITAKRLTGSGAVTGNALTINCAEDSNYSGASAVAFTIGGDAVQTLSGAYTGALTVNDGAQVVLAGAANPSSIANAGTVTVDPNGAVMTLSGAITGEGNIYVTDSSEEGLGSVAFTGDRSEFTGMIVYTRGLYGIGEARVLDIPEGIELQDEVNIAATQTHAEYATGVDTTITGLTDGMLVVLTKLDGTTETLTAENGEVTFPGSGEVKIDGAATLFDVTFTNYVWDMEHQNNGTFSYKGVDGALLKYDSAPTFANTNGEAQVKDIGVYIKHHPYIGEAAKAINGLGDFTAVFVGEMSPTANRIFVHFGSSTGSNQGIMIATLEGKDAVGVFSNKGGALTELTELSVPNAATARHVYIVTKTEVAGNTVFTIYLDGVKRAEYTLEGKFELGSTSSSGVQVGADFGGGIRTGTYKAVDNVDSETGVLNVMRIYDYLLTDDQVEALRVEYPYVSEGGLYTRTVAGEVDYAATAAWAKDPSTEPEYDVPTGTEQFTPSATLTAGDEAVVTVNTNSEIDVFTFTGSAMSFVKDEDGTNRIAVSTAFVNAPITIQYGALDLSKAAVSLSSGGTVAFDLADFPLDTYFMSEKIQLTGLTEDYGEDIKGENIPESDGREATVVFEDGVYKLVIAVADEPFVYNEGWTWNGGSVSAETVSNNTAVAVVVEGNLEWPIDRASFTVDVGGTFSVTSALVSASSVTVSADGVLDLNGSNTKELALTLNGGKVTNGGAAITGSNQIKTIALGDDSEINVPNAYEVYAVNYNTATTIALAEGRTLTKTGAATLKLVNTDVVSNGVFYVSEGTVFSGESTRFEEAATLKIGESGTWEQREGDRKTTVGKIVGEGGTLKVAGKITDFTLTGTLALAGNGTFGTITLEDDATLNVGTKRGLALEGNGTVNAQLTVAEMSVSDPITLFTTTESEGISVKLTDYTGQSLVEDDDYTIEGGVVTPKAVPFIYNTRWTWNGHEVEPSVVAATTAAAIFVNGGTCEWNIDRDITVNGGTLKATGKKKATAAITVNDGATFDVNGVFDTRYAIVLNGGALVNDGAAIPENKMQYESISVTANSTVGGLAKFDYIRSQYGASTLDLGEATLTKVGTNMFVLAKCTVTNGTFVVSEGTLQINHHPTTFASDATLTVGENGTLDVANTLNIASIAAAEGATVKLTNNQRGLAFTGAGTVVATLTDDEYEAGAADIFTGDGSLQVFYNGEDITSKCTIDGGSITAIQKTPPVPEWIDPDDTENVEKYNAWALAKGVNDPNDAIKEAFLFNVANDESAVETAKGNFKIHGIEIDSDGTVTIEPPNPSDVGVEFFNGTVILRGSATLDGDYTVEEGDWDETTRFFKAFLELIPAN